MTTESSERRTIARNAATSYAARGVVMLSVLLITPYLFRRLGTGGFGTWSVMLTLTTIFTLVEVGFSDGVVRLVAAARAAGDGERIRRTVAAGGAIMSVFGLLALGAAAAAGIGLAGLAASEHRDAFTAGMVALGVAHLVRFPMVAFGAALKGYQRFDLWNASAIVTVVLSAAGAVVAVESGAGIFGIAVAQGVALVAGGLLYAASLGRLDRRALAAPGLADGETRRLLVRFSSLTLAAESFLQIGQRLDVPIIAALRSAGAAAPYAAALKLQSGVQGVTLPFVDLLMPMASHLWAHGERETIWRRLTVATRIAAQLTLPLALGIALFAHDIVAVWLGPSAPRVTATIVVVLMAVQIVGLTAAPARKILIGVGRVRLIAILSLVEGVASVVLTVVLVSAYGALGAAIATVIAVGAIAPLKLPLASRALGFPTVPFLRDSLGRALLATAPAVGAMTLVRVLLEPGTGRLAAGLGAGFALWAATTVPQLLPLRASLRPKLARTAP